MQNQIKQRLKRVINAFNKPHPDAQLNMDWTRLDFILNSPNFTPEYLQEKKHVQEIEHQVGRFLNMKKIFAELESSEIGGIKGDVVEFGTWQGLGLIYFARLLGENTHHRRLIGIDSFEGLPHDSTIWKRGDFADTELNFVIDNILKYSPSSFKKDSFDLIKGWFSDPLVRNQLYEKVKNVALVHFDADLYSSTIEALDIIAPYLKNRVEPIYFLFDDWGCHPDEVPDAFFEWLANHPEIHAQKVSSTRFTRYYKLIFR